MNEYVNDFNTIVKTYYDDLKKYKPVSRIREKELIRLAKRNNQRAKNELIEANLRFVFDVAKRYKGKGVSMSDLISEGNMGLLKAIDKFNEKYDVKFFSYAVWWIRQAMQDAIKKRQISNSIEKGEEELNTVVISNTVNDIEDDVVKKNEVIFSNEYDEHKKEIEESQKKIVSKLLEKLQPREKEIIERYFGLNGREEQNLGEIGKVLGISMERVRQIKANVFKILRAEILLMPDAAHLFK